MTSRSVFSSACLISLSCARWSGFNAITRDVVCFASIRFLASSISCLFLLLDSLISSYSPQTANGPSLLIVDDTPGWLRSSVPYICLILSLGFIWNTSSTVNIANGSPSNTRVNSSPFSNDLRTSAFVFPDGARIKGNGNVFPFINPVFKTFWLSFEFIKEVAGASNPSFNNSKADTASLSI